MARKFHKAKRTPPYLRFMNQYSRIKNTYGNIESSQIHGHYFEIVMNVTPSENSATYKVKISCRMGYRPKVVLLSPDLEKRDGKYPHHIYGFDKEGHATLCVYCPHKDEWNSNMSIATSFIPWISTWLNTYEYWLITCEWHYDEVVNYTETKE